MKAWTESGSPSDGPCRSLSYSIFWNGVPAGKADVHCARSEGRTVVTLTGRTEALMDAFYPVTFDAESLLVADGLAAQRYREKTREGRGKEKTELLVFGDVKTAGQEGTITVDVFKNGRLRRTLHVPQGTLDPLGAVHRFLGASENQGPFFVTDGRRVFEVRTIPGRREELATPLGRRSVQLWNVAVTVVMGKPHVLERAAVQVWTLADNPSAIWKATVALPYGRFSTQMADAG